MTLSGITLAKEGHKTNLKPQTSDLKQFSKSLRYRKPTLNLCFLGFTSESFFPLFRGILLHACALHLRIRMTVTREGIAVSCELRATSLGVLVAYVFYDKLQAAGGKLQVDFDNDEVFRNSSRAVSLC